ncbi:cobyrinate a,c-diamide synthase [Shumkonia mesophila]|uniref:cobyrinate a,c-diamide synthase n=1 Tax=Shumkonia mesophila TaxID=2838854 RepID=UPI00293512B0|nr:cobyrinate a,c-diamide synthase [Shumkonia mesophila]
MAHILISATHKSSGKTTIALGLCAALKRRGLAVQPFKKGPDYIDPMWLAAAAGGPCHNLDFNTMPPEEIRETFARHAAGADIAVIEGNNGLYDGTDLEGSNSNAALAKLLEAPVVLVIDCAGMARGVAPLLMGYVAFDPRVTFAGVVLNNVANPRHESKLRAAIERYTDVRVLGAVPRAADLSIAERHLGLVPTVESGVAAAKLAAAADAVEKAIDLDALLELAGQAPAIAAPAAVAPGPRPAGVTIAVARDSAFGFYYASDLDALRAAGAEVVFFDTLRDQVLPPADGLVIGGGFPETHLAALEANAALQESIREAIEGGLPAYAECGGLMYLARRIAWRGESARMVGVIPADVMVHEKPRGHGYVRLRETAAAPWPREGSASVPVEIPAHEFHYSDLGPLEGEAVFAYDVLRGHGIDGNHDGLVVKNLLAGYAHLRHTAGNPWTRRFVDFVRSCKAGNRY